MLISPRVRSIVVWTAAALGVVSLAWSLAMMLSGLSPLVVADRTGALPEGSLALTRLVEIDSVVPGDVVALPATDGSWVTRTVSRAGAVDGLDQPLQAQSVQQVVGRMPWVGPLVQTIMSPVGAFVAGVLSGAATLAVLTDERLVSRGRRLSAARARTRATLIRTYSWALLVAWVGLLAGVLGQQFGALTP